MGHPVTAQAAALVRLFGMIWSRCIQSNTYTPPRMRGWHIGDRNPWEGSCSSCVVRLPSMWKSSLPSLVAFTSCSTMQRPRSGRFPNVLQVTSGSPAMILSGTRSRSASRFPLGKPTSRYSRELEKAMIVDIPGTITSKISKKIMALREQGGVIALGRKRRRGRHQVRAGRGGHRGRSAATASLPRKANPSSRHSCCWTQCPALP